MLISIRRKPTGWCVPPDSQLTICDSGLTRTAEVQRMRTASSSAPPPGRASLFALCSGACALRPQPAASSRSGTSGAQGAVPGRGAARGNGAAARPAGGGERWGHEGEPGKRQLSRRGGAPVPEDSESAELGAGAGRRGEAGPFPQERVPGPSRPVVWQQLQVKVAPAASSLAHSPVSPPEEPGGPPHSSARSVARGGGRG